MDSVELERSDVTCWAENRRVRYQCDNASAGLSEVEVEKKDERGRVRDS